MKISENRARQLERAAPAIAKNQRLHESVEALEKMLAGAHGDREKLLARMAQLEAENWALIEQLGEAVNR